MHAVLDLNIKLKIPLKIGSNGRPENLLPIVVAEKLVTKMCDSSQE